MAYIEARTTQDDAGRRDALPGDGAPQGPADSDGDLRRKTDARRWAQQTEVAEWWLA